MNELTDMCEWGAESALTFGKDQSKEEDGRQRDVGPGNEINLSQVAAAAHLQKPGAQFNPFTELLQYFEF